jgi:putative AlgH/UPF0301 family transcriptional regulator
MGLSKRCFLTALVVVVAFAAVPRFEVQTKEPDIRTRGSRPYHPAVARDESLWHAGLVQSNWVFHAKREISSSIFLPVQSKNPKELGAGKLLVASRALADPNFGETVILLVHSDADGVVGLILNRRTEVPLSRVLDQFEGAKDRSDPVYLGGPVEMPAAFALLRSPAKLDGAEQILGGVYLISTKSLFDKAFAGRPGPGMFHVYLGYAGWSNEQLRQEIELGSWFIFPGDAQTIFDSDPDDLWRQMIQKTEFKLARREDAAVAVASVGSSAAPPLVAFY